MERARIAVAIPAGTARPADAQATAAAAGEAEWLFSGGCDQPSNDFEAGAGMHQQQLRTMLAMMTGSRSSGERQSAAYRCGSTERGADADRTEEEEGSPRNRLKPDCGECVRIRFTLGADGVT